MEKIKVIVLFVLVICTTKSYSQDYFEILSLNHPNSIKIGGVMKNAKRNKIFNEKDKIEWVDALQWIKAKKVNDKSKDLYKFSFHEFKKLGVGTVRDYLIKKKQLAHKGGQRIIASENTFYLFGTNDTLFLERKEQNNERKIVKAKWKCDGYQGESQIFPTSDGKFYVIPSGVFHDIQSLPKSISLSVREELLDENSIYNVYPQIEVYYLPD